MVHMGSHGHVTDVLFIVHDPTDLVYCEIHRLGLSLDWTTSERMYSVCFLDDLARKLLSLSLSFSFSPQRERM